MSGEKWKGEDTTPVGGDWRNDPRLQGPLKAALLEMHERQTELHREAKSVKSDVRNLRDEVASTNGEVVRMAALMTATALRVSRLDREREIPFDRLAELRRDVERMKATASRVPSYSDLSDTARREVKRELARVTRRKWLPTTRGGWAGLAGAGVVALSGLAAAIAQLAKALSGGH